MVQDDIAFSHFGDSLSSGSLASSAFSPNMRFFVIHTEHGRLDLGKPESTLRIFRTRDVETFLRESAGAIQPLPVWTFAESAYKDGPVVSNIRWLADSSGIAFLAKTQSGNDQLMVANLDRRSVHALTPETQHITGFDIRDLNHVVYTALSPAIQERMSFEGHAPSIVGTGRDLYSLIFSSDIHSEMEQLDRSELWAIVDGRRFQVEDKFSRRPVTIYSTGQQALSLSPDGHWVATALPAAEIQFGWETQFSPGDPILSDQLRPHKQDTEAFSGFRYINEYVLVNLYSGAVKQLTNAPIGKDLGWHDSPVFAVWAADQRFVVLPNTFLPLNPAAGNQHQNYPCVAVFDIHADNATCVESLGVATQESSRITNVQISSNQEPRRITLDYVGASRGSAGERTYGRAKDDRWTPDFTESRVRRGDDSITISVKQSLNDPPVLMATDTVTQISRPILDPNPQLEDFDLGEARTYKWKNETGRESSGGLYMPPDYVEGRRYPLVIQTHGFPAEEFNPSGMYTSAFAARELASADIMVLQMNDLHDCAAWIGTPKEAPCAVADYEAAVEQLSRDGLVDSDLFGIIGFSRTSYYVMQALTASMLHFKAASISDGFNAGYFQYLAAVDLNGNAPTRETDAVVGSGPFGDGLRQWIERSPEFNASKVTAPLRVVALNRASILGVWEPYAELRALKKPVDLLVLPEGTHVLSNPTGRMVSQGGTVDWFRFWLQNYEDPDPGKADQYARWRDLRKLQEQNHTTRPTN
jgi:dipeptidyl aminopeptidase/acylaminoacyl peptidase